MRFTPSAFFCFYLYRSRSPFVGIGQIGSLLASLAIVALHRLEWNLSWYVLAAVPVAGLAFALVTDADVVAHCAEGREARPRCG